MVRNENDPGNSGAKQPDFAVVKDVNIVTTADGTRKLEVDMEASSLEAGQATGEFMSKLYGAAGNGKLTENKNPTRNSSKFGFQNWEGSTWQPESPRLRLGKPPKNPSQN